VPRLLLVANANARRVSGYRRDVITHALASEFKLEVVETTRPGHATEVAREGALDGVEVIAALGGDGTVNEVVNGLAGTDSALAILPAGLANVFARSLGVPNDAIEATGLLLKCVAMGTAPRRVPLGRADGRFFTTNCGIGFDGAIVRRVEHRQRIKRQVGEWYFVWSAVRLFLRGYDRRAPRIRLAWGDRLEESRSGLYLAIVQNTSPYTYFGGRGMRLCPDAALDDGLDGFAIDTMRLRAVLPVVVSAFGSARHDGWRHVTSISRQRRMAIECDHPMPVQMDGEFVGERSRLLVESVPDALAVLY
jgi:diacylglycerol kinase family enzyme